MEQFHFKKAEKVLVFGAGHGIGLSLVKELKRRYPEIEIIATYRDASKASGLFELKNIESYQLNPIEEDSLIEFSQKLKNQMLDAIIITIGILECGDKTPEKSMRHLSLEKMQQYFAINTFLTPLIAKTFQAHLSRKKPSLLAALSAKVGSLEENELGGWHSYRASKAALNMYLKCLGLEFKQSKIPCAVMALHPGTVDTSLSQSFLKTVQHKIWSADEAANNLINVMDSFGKAGTAVFLDYNGEKISW